MKLAGKQTYYETHADLCTSAAQHGIPQELMGPLLGLGADSLLQVPPFS
jgi:hypothetical protein